MATFNQYVCPHCGYEILTEPRFYYRLMSGYQVTRKCSECKEIIREHFDDLFEIPHFEFPEQFFHWIESYDFRTKYGICPECHKHARLTLWSPIMNRCPKCRHTMKLKVKNIMFVD